jgi:hypothetical protein
MVPFAADPNMESAFLLSSKIFRSLDTARETDGVDLVPRIR